MLRTVLIGIVSWLATAPPSDAAGPVIVKGRPADVGLRDVGPQVYHCFGDRAGQFVLDVQGVTGARLDLAGRLFQRTNAIEAPVDEPFKIADNLELAEATRRAVTASIGLPAVKHPTSFRVQFLARDHLAETWRPAGELALVVYPPELLSEVRGYAEGQAIALDDPGGTLTSFFAAHKIAYQEVGRLPVERTAMAERQDPRSGKPSRHPNLALLVPQQGTDGGDPQRASHEVDALRLKGYRVVRFLENVESLPHIRIHDFEGGRWLDVEMRLLDSLTTDPRSQALLVEIIRIAINDDRP